MWVDPMLALVVFASYEQAMRGEPVDARRILDFSKPDEQTPTPAAGGGVS